MEMKQTTLKKLDDENRYFILRKGSNSYSLKNIILNQDKMTMTANLFQVPPEHQVYLKANRKSKYHYSKSRGQHAVLKEVHLYTGDTSRVDISVPYSLALADVQKIEMIEFDQRRTTSSYIWGTIGVALGTALVVAIIAAATYEPPPPPPPGSSCPYISAYNGDQYTLQGEIYSAAIYPSLQKEDYLPLQVKPVQGNYLVKISNELKEIQHTDFADLLVVEHDKNVRVIMDPGGKPYTISAPKPASSAMLNNQTDVRGDILYKDNISCLFKDNYSAGNSQDLYLTFTKDISSKQGKLILNAKTSSWVNYLYGEFTRAFGSQYNNWVKQQEKKPAGELEKWSDEQQIPLTISIKTGKGWEEIKKIKTIGPILHREMVISLDLLVSGLVELKLSTGFLFWELDYAAMDFSRDEDLTVRELKPYQAINERGVDVLPEILQADKKFITQPDIGDFTILTYKARDVKAGMTQTFFLHASGYYKPLRDYKGTPKIGFLKSFQKAGAFPAFSRQKFSGLLNNFTTAKN
ncbi:MAG: hypothetical protein WKF97_26765 [Chitinophagaceae bacterium]